MLENKVDMVANDILPIAESDYDRSNHRMGRITLSAGFLASLLPPVILWVLYGIIPPFKNLLSGIISITSVMLPVSIVEVLTFAPILGAGALYMAYLTGNISNLKIPAAVISMEAAGVKPSSREGDIIANLAISGSVIASEIILILGVLLLVPISGKLNNPILKPAFEQILPALFGSLGAYYILKEWKLAVMPLVVAIGISSFHGLPTAVTVPLSVGVSILSARFLYKKKLIKGSERIEE